MVRPNRELTLTTVPSLIDSWCRSSADPAPSFHLDPPPHNKRRTESPWSHTQTALQTKGFHTHPHFNPSLGEFRFAVVSFTLYDVPYRNLPKGSLRFVNTFDDCQDSWWMYLGHKMRYVSIIRKLSKEESTLSHGLFLHGCSPWGSYRMLLPKAESSWAWDPVPLLPQRGGTDAGKPTGTCRGLPTGPELLLSPSAALTHTHNHRVSGPWVTSAEPWPWWPASAHRGLQCTGRAQVEVRSLREMQLLLPRAKERGPRWKIWWETLQGCFCKGFLISASA